MAEKVKIEVVGVSLNKNNSSPFIVILGEQESNVRIPIIIGGAEAQAIAIALEQIPVLRPLTHDTFATMTKLYEIDLTEIFIYNYEKGVFSAEMVFSKDGVVKKLDSRTSDAVALALRMSAPIYTTREIITEAGIIINDDEEDEKMPPRKLRLKDLDTDGLDSLLNESIKSENYEMASRVHAEIKRRKAE